MRRNVQRQAFAGMLWSKQFYHYVVKSGSKVIRRCRRRRQSASRRAATSVDASLQRGRDLDARQVGVPVVRGVGPRVSLHPAGHGRSEFAKEQLILMLREWYMHPNGQIPAYEWAFGDVNPPVHAWAALRVYKIEKKRTGKGDTNFSNAYSTNCC